MTSHICPRRRLQGAAVSASTAVVALGRGCRLGAAGAPFAYFLSEVLHGFLWVPAVRDLMLATPVCRAAVVQVYEDLLEVPWPQFGAIYQSPALPLSSLALMARVSAPEVSDVTLVLARLGVLSRLARWGQLNCGQARSSEVRGAGWKGASALPLGAAAEEVPDASFAWVQASDGWGTNNIVRV